MVVKNESPLRDCVFLGSVAPTNLGVELGLGEWRDRVRTDVVGKD